MLTIVHEESRSMVEVLKKWLGKSRRGQYFTWVMLPSCGCQCRALSERLLRLGLMLRVTKISILHRSSSSHPFNPGQRLLVTKAHHAMAPALFAVRKASVTLETAFPAGPAP